MKKKAKIILSAVISIMVICFIGMSYFMGSQIVLGSTQLVTNGATKGVPDGFWQEYGIDYNEFIDTYSIESMELTSSSEGHAIPADYIYAKGYEENKDNDTVILVHGLGGNRYSNYPLAEFFLDEGFNVISYDQRSSGENIAKHTTFGYLERHDLTDYVSFVEEQAPDKRIGIWGTSFGGATAGLALGYDIDNKVDFLILDCPISEMRYMIEQEMEGMNLGIPVSYMTWSGNIANKLKLGFDYDDANVPKAIKEIQTPVLIINSKIDTVTPYFMGEDIYNAIQNDSKKIWTVEDSKHAEIWLDYNEEYRTIMKEFIR